LKILYFSGISITQKIENNSSTKINPKADRDFPSNDFYFDQDEVKAMQMILELEKTRSFEKRQIMK
jgi:hypothetical protein